MRRREPGVLRALADLVLGWWRVDRVRISPREGRLLRLEPPCLLRLGDTLTRVTGRRTGQRPDGPYVVYSCHDGSSGGRLWVLAVGPNREPLVRWESGDMELTVSEDDVEVYPLPAVQGRDRLTCLGPVGAGARTRGVPRGAGSPGASRLGGPERATPPRAARTARGRSV